MHLDTIQIEKEIKSSFAWLDEFGYYFIGSNVQESKVVGENIDFNFENKVLKKKITVTVLHTNHKKEVINQILFSITRVPYDSQSDFISLKKYLLKQGVKFDIQSLQCVNYKGGFDQQIISVSNYIKKLVIENCLEIISTNEWDEFAFPDW